MACGRENSPAAPGHAGENFLRRAHGQSNSETFACVRRVSRSTYPEIQNGSPNLASYELCTGGNDRLVQRPEAAPRLAIGGCLTWPMEADGTGDRLQLAAERITGDAHS